MTQPSFEQFYTDNWSALAGYCRAMCGSAQLGDDLAQETFARLYVRFPLLREPRAYAFRVAANLARRAARLREVPVADLPAVAESVGVDHELLDAVHRLPARLRAVVLLHYFADLSVDQVAAALRRPQGTVKRQLSEARSELGTVLGGTR